MYNEVLTLIREIEEGVDEYGDPAKKELKRDIFCKVKSIGVSEFYQAFTIGTKPEIKAVIADYLDYEGEQDVILQGIRYKVLRTYRTEDNALELTLYGGVRVECTKERNEDN